jgi:hypothetical protein
MVARDGSTYPSSFGDVSAYYGYSRAHPTAFQSYDPAEPENELSHGRGPGPKPKIFTRRTGELFSVNSAGNEDRNRHYALRGFDVDPGFAVGRPLIFFNRTSGILLEGNILRNVQISGGGDFDRSITATSWAIRKNVFHGTWHETEHAGAIYAVMTTDLLIEDNLFAHIGWRPGASRNDAPAHGGATIFRHCIYTVEDTRSVTIRRNIMVDPSATGGSVRGDCYYYQNIHIDCPLSGAFGPGDDPIIRAPLGAMRLILENLTIGDADINADNPRSGGYVGGNFAHGSTFRRNLMIHSRNPAGNIVWSHRGHPILRSSVDYSDNREYLFGNVYQEEGAASNAEQTFGNNYGAPASGGLAPRIYPYDPAAAPTARHLWGVLGYGSKEAWLANLIEHPESVAEQVKIILPWMFVSYGMKIDLGSASA